MTVVRKKLIEVALPLEAINVASAREKSIRHGHPSTLHLWWARRPLAAARAVIFAQMVDDPSSWPDLFPTEKAQEKERQRLFRIIEKLVLWENTTNEEVLEEARREIWASWRRACAENADHPQAAELFDRNKLPAFHDPFAGGGALPLEAQRLGLEAHATDLNPVAVLINKAMIEIPPKFAGRPPVNPEWQKKPQREKELRQWRGAQGLADDVRYYGQWLRDEAEKRIGHLYPKVEVTAEVARGRPDLKPYVGRRLRVIAWLWVRTVKSPNPAFAHVNVPLASTFILSAKPGREAVVEPVIAGGGYRFTVRVGKAKVTATAKGGTKHSRGANFECLMSGTPVTSDYIRGEGSAKRMGARLMAIVAEGDRERVYLPPTEEHEAAAQGASAPWLPEGDTPPELTGGGAQAHRYGLTTWADLFTKRQMVTLTTLCDLLKEAIGLAVQGADGGAHPDGGSALREGGAGYAEAVAVYLGLAVDKVADYNTTLVAWSPTRDQAKSTFARQALPMAWDYAEVNPLAGAAGDFSVSLEGGIRFLETAACSRSGMATQADAATQRVSRDRVVSTDPPYYDNIAYADLSDFFYVWLRHSLRPIFPDLFATLAVPKAEELVALSYRHLGGKAAAEAFFLEGMTRALHGLRDQAHPSFPVTIYYAFKQSENAGGGATFSTGWETFLEATIRAGFAITGTWPIRTEREVRTRGIGSNALASSIVLVCRKTETNAPVATRREFATVLKGELPGALSHLQRGNIAPVDLAQAAIGPGMAVYTRYSRVLDAEGKPLAVREALALINQTLDESLAAQEGDFDADSRWSLTWFEQFGFAEGDYGVAEQLSKSKNTSVAGMVGAGILDSKRGRVRLLRPEEMAPDWDPIKDARLTAWEMVHQLVRVLGSEGEDAAAALVAKLGSKAEVARELCYRLYTICERKKRAADALSYNALVQSWPELVRLAREGGKPRSAQADLFGDGEE